jgi:hypothetical protein
LGLNAEFYFQPSQLPDFNVDDLAFFASLQAMYHKLPRHSIDSLIEAILKSYNDYPKEKLNLMFLTLMSVMDEAIKQGGGNFYRIPHLGKGHLKKINELPLALDLSDEAYQRAIA